MTIRNFDTGEVVTGVLQKGKRGETYRLISSRLSVIELEAIRAALDRHIQGSRIETASWIPGGDWRETPYQPIYEKAAKRHYELAAMMFGLLAWEAFERHESDWYTERFSMDGDDDRFRVYFMAGA